MCRSRCFLPFLLLAMFSVRSSARAAEGPFIGLDLGVSEPTNDNYRAHVHTGGTGAPFVGYMFNDYFGVQGQFHLTFQLPDSDRRRFIQADIENERQTTTMVGGTIGPRLQMPLGDLFDVYLTGQGGGFKGLGGRLNQWAPGFLVGGGVDVNVTPNVAVGLFGRWNRAYMSPHPTFLVQHVADDQGPKDARWATAGVSLKYTFAQPAPPPPPPPPAAAQAPPPPPAPPAVKMIVLRNVHFDFDKANIRPDARPVLDEAVKTLLEDKEMELVIVEAHTDSVGSEAYNVKLSRRRANAVRDYLVGHGLAASRIRAEGFGESRPVASNDTAEGRALNRRVELHIQ